MPKKAPLSNADKATVCANLVIKAAHDFQYLGFGVKDIGIPPPSACAPSCSGHGVADFCVICHFNGCKVCGSARVHKHACWSGACPVDHTGEKKYLKHTLRVQQILKDRAAELPVPLVAPVKKAKAAAVPKPVEKVAMAPKKAKAKKITARIRLNQRLTVGATTGKVVQNARTGEWTLKLSVKLRVGDV